MLSWRMFLPVSNCVAPTVNNQKPGSWRCVAREVKCLNRYYSRSAASVDLSGIFPPIPTPFNKDESIAYDKLASNIQRWEKVPFQG